MSEANSSPPAMLPKDCPVFDHCNAAICPLDPLWRKHYMRSNEAVCRYLLATNKAGAAEHYADDPTFAAVRNVAEEVMTVWPPIAKKVASAGRKSFRGSSGATPSTCASPCRWRPPTSGRKRRPGRSRGHLARG